MPRTPSLLRQRRVMLGFNDLHLHESVPLLGRYDYQRAGDMLEEHRHPEAMEICYLARGRQTYRVHGRNYTLLGHDLFLTFPGETHSTGGAPEEKGMLYWIQVRLDGRGRFLHLQQAESQALRQALRQIGRRHFKGSRGLQRLFEEVFLAYEQTPPPLRRLAVAERICALLLAVLEHARRPQPQTPVRKLDEVLQYIGEHLAERLSLEELAGRAGLSLPWFKARFRRYTGIPPAEYILRARIERARQLLAAPQASVTGVALALGFSSSQYFATVYKRFTGSRPGEHLGKDRAKGRGEA